MKVRCVMAGAAVLNLGEVERRVCDLTAEHLALARHKVSPASSLVEDLHCDSLDFVELVLAIEQAFGVTIPDRPTDPLCKAVFARSPFRLADLAEIVYLRQGTGPPIPRPAPAAAPAPPGGKPFTQLDGVWRPNGGPLHERVTETEYRRRSDGMRCVLVPAGTATLGADAGDADPDERPAHRVRLDAYLIDAEPVSAAAYCRFLNSARPVPESALAEWFVLDPADDRTAQAPLARAADGWRPVPGTARKPVVLVSWYGAAAYALWANGRDWGGYRDAAAGGAFLPTEAQWEYAAREPGGGAFPWGDAEPTADTACVARHRPGATYRADGLSVPDVTARLGVSPLGVRHMAGTVWQWCRDWYDPDFYRRPEAADANPENRAATGVRSERGGSWVGPAGLCRSSYRRGRPPLARGRCLGFRCVGSPADLG